MAFKRQSCYQCQPTFGCTTVQTFKQFENNYETAAGLLLYMNTTNFVGTLLMLKKEMPHLNTLSLKLSLEHTKAMIQNN